VSGICTPPLPSYFYSVLTHFPFQ